jgi:hypothetical protein
VYLTPTGIVSVTFTGTNFVTGDVPVCTPDSNVQNVTVVNSTTITANLAIDSPHVGYGYRQCKICKSDGTGCSATLPFGVYGQNQCGVVQSTGEKLCLNLGEIIAGQNSGANGYVDGFSAVTGAPNGTHCFVGSAWVGVIVDNLTGFWSIDGNPRDATCNINTSVPTLTGGSLHGVTAMKMLNSYIVALQPATTPHKVSCVSWIGPGLTSNPVLFNDVGSNPQSLAMGVTSSKTYAYSYDAVGQAIYKTDASTCTTTINFAVTGITAGAPNGTEIVVFDSLGLGVLVSYGDKIAVVFNETTLKQVGSDITLPGTPINVIATGNVAIIGNFDGTFVKVDPSAGTASVISSEQATFMPVGMIPAVTADGVGVDFYACPNDGVSNCSSFTIH